LALSASTLQKSEPPLRFFYKGNQQFLFFPISSIGGEVHGLADEQMSIQQVFIPPRTTHLFPKGTHFFTKPTITSLPGPRLRGVEINYKYFFKKSILQEKILYIKLIIETPYQL